MHAIGTVDGGHLYPSIASALSLFALTATMTASTIRAARAMPSSLPIELPPTIRRPRRIAYRAKRNSQVKRTIPSATLTPRSIRPRIVRSLTPITRPSTRITMPRTKRIHNIFLLLSGELYLRLEEAGFFFLSQPPCNWPSSRRCWF